MKIADEIHPAVNKLDFTPFLTLIKREEEYS
jgi:hypothetical protein